MYNRLSNYMKKAVITYFEPFGGRKTNASKEVVLGMNTSFEVVGLPVSWKRSLPIINKIMDKDPRYIFLIGEAGNYPDVTVELMAKNVCSGTDEDGETKSGSRILGATPKSLKTNFNTDGLTCPMSLNAGKFLCNYVYYICLLRSEITKVIFIHVPYLHSKGSRKKEAVIKKVENIIHTLLEKDDEFYVRLNDKIVTVNESNAYDLFVDIQATYDLPNILIGISRNEDGSYEMTGRADGFKGTWYESGSSKAEELDSKKRIYYCVLYFLLSLDDEEREESSVFVEKTHRFDFSEYDGSEKLFKRYLILFISRADYSDEMNFYISLDRIQESLLKSVVDAQEENAIKSAKDYISRLGLKRTTELLFREVK